jgi:hypothetical protein
MTGGGLKFMHSFLLSIQAIYPDMGSGPSGYDGMFLSSHPVGSTTLPSILNLAKLEDPPGLYPYFTKFCFLSLTDKR